MSEREKNVREKAARNEPSRNDKKREKDARSSRDRQRTASTRRNDQPRYYRAGEDPRQINLRRDTRFTDIWNDRR
jgi:hypothetical protein